jgi:hypothetical protein
MCVYIYTNLQSTTLVTLYMHFIVSVMTVRFAKNHCMKILSVLTSQYSECVLMIQSEILLSKFIVS